MKPPGMVPQLARVARDFSIRVYSTSGFDALTAKKNIADRIVEVGKPTILLHVGDFDPSGESIYTAVTEDVAAFVEADRHIATVTVEFRRVALTGEQIRFYNLETVPPKETNSRTKNWTGGGTCQLEALAPDTLQELLHSAIEDLFDMDQLTLDENTAYVERQWLAKALPAPSSD